MLNEILAEYDKTKEKDISTKKSIRNIISDLKSNLQTLGEELEEAPNQMTVNLVYKNRT
jgi:hypothetical protein